MSFHAHPQRPRRGFTLIELMVVIAIIGVLAVIVVPRVMNYLEDANVVAAKAQITSFKSALNRYKIHFHKYPSTSEGLDALINNGWQNLLDAESVPNDPWGNPYEYASPGNEGRDYEIICYGADGMPGGSDYYDKDIESWNLKGDEEE
jgi:general secretion pathway protein G